MTQTSSDVSKRPTAVTLIGVLLILICILYLIQGIVGISTADVLQSALANLFNAPAELTPQARTTLENALDILRGLFALILLVGFFRLRRWSWVAIMLWAALALLRQLFRVFVGEPAYFLMGLEVITIFALNQADVQKIFGIKRDEHDTLTASLNSVDGQ